RLVGAVVDLVRAIGADGEGDDLALGQDAPAVGCAQVRRALEDDEHLLLAEVEVVRVGGLAGRQLPQADPDARRGELVAEPRAPAGEPGVAAGLVELWLAEVGHGWVLSRRLCAGRVVRSAVWRCAALTASPRGRRVWRFGARVVDLSRVRLW